MLKAVIVDDEPIIREGMKSIIDWEEWGFEIIGDASDGLEGVSLCEVLKPDLVIADVRMPGMDGLEMIEALKSKGLDCKFIILSAYSDFDYARKAIELGATSYMLKPIEESELISKISKIRNTIERERKAKKGLTLSRDKALENIVLGKYEPYYNELYSLGFPWRCYQIALLHICEEDAQAKDAARDMAAQAMSCRYSCHIVYIGGDICILFENDNYDEALARFLANIRSRIEEAINVKAFISAGCPVREVCEIKTSYEQAYGLMKQRFTKARDGIIMDIQKPNEDPILEIDGLPDELYAAVDVGNAACLSKLMEDFKAHLLYKEASEEYIKISYVNLYTMILERLRVNNKALSDIARIDEDVINKAYSSLHIDELHQSIKDKLMYLANEIAKIRPDSAIVKIVDYMDRNYACDIKLAKIADAFGYNSAYLGKLFKDFTGKSFNDYLNEIRIRKAKEFLKAGMKVSQAAQMAGYNDVDYFYRTFKKYTGNIPSSYRK